MIARSVAAGLVARNHSFIIGLFGFGFSNDVKQQFLSIFVKNSRLQFYYSTDLLRICFT